jgi:signal transduction histidine kinase/phage shock protein PspC (stress-responsive transcriptional regulator)
MAEMSASAPARLRRDKSRGAVAGVAAGLAGRLGIDPIIVRVGFITAAFAGGAGIAAYLLAWALMPAEGSERAPIDRLAGRRELWMVVGGVVLLVIAVLLLLREWGIWLSDAVVWPVLLTAAGAALIWRQSTAAASDEREMKGSDPSMKGSDPSRLASGASFRMPADVAGRALVGAALVVGGGLVFLWLNDALQPARDVLLAVVVVLVALTLILAPWWLRLVRGLSAERAERIRSQERAEVAAHLHDSVLQTLALMQKRVDDPREVAALARRQERELRAWLNHRRSSGDATVATALEATAAEVEEAHGVPLEVVAVGDAPLDERAQALVAAAREALVNAAKFGGDGPVVLYAEVDDDRIEVFVRDRGPGFDPGAVPADRRGVRESIIGRMRRHGGRATVHSAPGQGTEIELVLERR